MMHRKRNNSSLPLLVFVIFALIGCGMLIGGFIVLKNSLQFRETAVEVTGTITGITSHQNSDGDVRHTVQVSYSYNGQEFSSVPLGYYSSSMYKGKDIILLVDPEDPGHMLSKSGDAFAYIFLLAMGAIFAAVGIIPLICSLASSKKAKKLMATGRQLHAVVEYTDINTSVAYNGRHPFIVFCTYQDSGSGMTYRFKSRNLMRNPGYAPGDPIEVFVDPEDYSHYTVVADGPANPQIIDYT
ncbi:MAG: DUF3592 domain-containing protein [Acetatifactor sp.]|nr:DUF3592 domain-containing protein [Acetatifactor sp.]